MKKLQTLKLKNFCSYDYSEIEFGDATVFYGFNGSGKSNILLALTTILFNHDFPDSYIRNGQKEASIEVVFTDGSSIFRERQKTKQRIRLTEANGKVTNFSSSKCTEEVRAFTGFQPVQLDRNASPDYLQLIQADAPQFLLDKSPEVVLRMLSALISGQGFELVKTELQGELRTLQSDEKHLIEQVGKAQANNDYLKSELVAQVYTVAEEIEAELKEVEATEREISELIKFHNILGQELTEDEQAYVVETLNNASDCMEKLASVRPMEAELRELKQVELAWDDAEQYLLLCQHELSLVEEELKATAKELQEYKCKQCGKLVREICQNC